MIDQNFDSSKSGHTQAAAQTLLDRPFDSLACHGWECLKSQTQTVSYEESALGLVGQIEFDSAPQASGQIFRLWRGIEESEGSWVVSACGHIVTGRFSRPELAQLVLIAIEILSIQEQLSGI